MAVYPIALVLLISLKTGHYGFAGLLSGIYVFANGIGNPVLGRLVDRYGQSRLLFPSTAVHLAGVLTIVALVEANAPDWSLIAPTIVIGVSFLPIGSLVRARWSLVLAGRPELSTAYSLESALDEVIFTFGPLTATLIATQIAPVWAFVVAGVLVVAGAVWLQRQRGTEPPAQEAGAPPHKSALRHRGMVLLMLAAAAMGATFASAEVSMVAFCGQRHETGFAGVALGCFAAGSAISGFYYGARTRTASVRDRFRQQAVLLGLLPALFLAAVNVPTLAVVAVVVGMGIAPTLITAFGLIESVIPNAVLTEGMSWLVTGLSVGYGIASSLVGRIADAHGARPAFSVGIGAGLLVAALAVALHARLRSGAASEPIAVA
jgi:MFS family permease